MSYFDYIKKLRARKSNTGGAGPDPNKSSPAARLWYPFLQPRWITLLHVRTQWSLQHYRNQRKNVSNQYKLHLVFSRLTQKHGKSGNWGVFLLG